MIEVEKWAKAHEALELRLEVMEFNEGAQAFYAHLEYAPLSRIMNKFIS